MNTFCVLIEFCLLINILKQVYSHKIYKHKKVIEHIILFVEPAIQRIERIKCPIVVAIYFLTFRCLAMLIDGRDICNRMYCLGDTVLLRSTA